MANIKSFPNNQDEYIGAQDVMRWLHGRTSGVFGADNNAAVAPVLDTMFVTVSDGNGWLSNDNADGIVWWINNEENEGSKLTLQVDMADAVLPRTDRVVVSWATTNYVDLPEVIILKGTPATYPVAPELTNNNLVRQISLAAITVPAGATAITASMIMDERLDDSVCGLVTERIGIDTSMMKAQFESFWNESISEQSEHMEEQKAAWDAFFEAVQNDSVVPVPTASDNGKVIIVNENGDGYTLGEAQTEIPITSEVPADSDMWIDPDESTVEESHLSDKNNPHGVTAEQIGAAKATELEAVANRKVEIKKVWENASPSSSFAAQTVSLNLSDANMVMIDYKATDTTSVVDSKIIKVGNTAMLSTNYNNISNSQAIVVASRSVTVSESKIVFEKGFTKKPNDTASSENNARAIPVAIYVIKGVQV